MRYLRRRLGLFLLTLWAALTVNFAMPRVMPGNEAQAVLATFRGVNPAALHALEIEFGVNVHQNIVITYFQYLGNCFTGQLGVTALRRPGGDRQSSDAAVDARPCGVTTVLAFVIGTLVGVAERLAAGRQDRRVPAAAAVHRLQRSRSSSSASCSSTYSR